MRPFRRFRSAQLLSGFALCALIGGPRISAALTDYSRRLADEKARKSAAVQKSTGDKNRSNRPDTTTASFDVPKAAKSDGAARPDFGSATAVRLAHDAKPSCFQYAHPIETTGPDHGHHRPTYEAQAPPSLIS